MTSGKKTISEVVELIDNRKIYLPAIQRKFVWSEEQITRLMDSIMRGYPFGTFLFWKLKKKTANDRKYSMYEFIKDYHERDRFRNEPAGMPFDINEANENNTFFAALDGQQRLTSLYIALKGSLSLKLPRKRKENDNAYPKKELFLNLHSEKASEDEDIAFEFEFLTEEEFNNPEEGKLWFKVKEILTFKDIAAVTMFLYNNSLGTDVLALKNLSTLFQVIKMDESVNYFEVDSEAIDDVLDIFVRVNSGGTVLSKTDLLFSTIVSYWSEARDEIDNFLAKINRIGDHYSFTNDFIMRTCLYVTDLPIKLKVETFGKDNVSLIKNEWENIKNAIESTVKVMNELGFSKENIIANNVLLPLIYYRYKFGDGAFENDYEPRTKLIVFDELREVRKFVVISQIRHIFGQSTSATLSDIRTELKKYNCKFILSQLQTLTFVGKRNLQYGKEDIEEWFDSYEKGPYTFMLLSLLYPNLRYGQIIFHQDHMHPYSAFEKKKTLLKLILPNGAEMTNEKVELWQRQRNTMANLQLLEGGENESKNKASLIEWLNIPENRSVVKYLPENIDYSLSNFDEFLAKRRQLMLDELEKQLL